MIRFDPKTMTPEGKKQSRYQSDQTKGINKHS